MGHPQETDPLGEQLCTCSSDDQELCPSCKSRGDWFWDETQSVDIKAFNLVVSSVDDFDMGED
jgi:hypothetical protein